jgi:uncharacterized protein YbaR (Trm112 family)
MSGGSIQYTKYNCPNCGHTLSNSSLIYVQEEGCCPVCKTPMKVDLAQALPNTLETKIGEIVVLFCYFGLVALVLNFSGVDVNSFINQSHPALLLLAVALLLAPAFVLVKWLTKREQSS